MPGKTSVLITGLDLEWSSTNRGATWDPNTIRTTLKQSFDILRAVPGLEIDVFEFNPDSKDSMNAFVEKVRAGHGGRPWDGALVGVGIRGDQELSHVFELLVNSVKEVSPSTTLLFSSTATDHLEAIQRNFPRLQLAT